MSKTEDALAELVGRHRLEIVKLANARDTFMRINGETACENTRLRGIIREFCEAELAMPNSDAEWRERWKNKPHVKPLFAEAAKK